MRLVLGILLSIIGTSTAAADQSTQKMAAASQCPEMHMAAVYVTQATEFELLDWCPQIIYHTDSSLARGRVADRLLLDRKGVAFYPETNTILLPISFDLSDPGDFSLLVHQVVRAYQTVNGMKNTAPCHAALTGQAFMVQASFLSDSGFDAMANESRLSAKYRGTCNQTQPVN